MEPVTPSRRGLPCSVKCGLFLLVGLIVYGGVWVYHRFKATSQAVHSAENLREIEGALLIYANDHGGHYPDRLSALLLSSDVDPKLFVVDWGSATPAGGSTPQARAAQMDAGGHCSYGYLGAGRTEADMNAETVMMYEADGVNPGGFVYLLYGDGHGSSESVSVAIADIVKTLKAAPPTTSPASVK